MQPCDSIRGIYLIFLIAILMTACNENVVYESNQRIPGNEWSRFDTHRFEVEIDDTVNAHNLLINVRNTGEYPRSNLFLFVSASSPSGAFTRDTLEFILAEPSGKWLGKGFGSVWQNRFYYRRNVRFPERGIYLFEFEQAMRFDDLPGILDIGLRIEKSDR